MNSKMRVGERKMSFMKRNDESYFCNFECKYFPCHKTGNTEYFNCLFCYCPLYALGENCGGSFVYTSTGIKDCSNCFLPHSPKGNQHILSKFSEIAKIIQKKK